MDANFFNMSLNESVHKCADMLERIHYDLEAMKPEAKPAALELEEPKDEKKAKFQSYLKNGLQDEEKRHEILFSSKDTIFESLKEKNEWNNGLINTNLKFAARIYYAVMQAIGGNDFDVSAMIPTMSTYDVTEQTIRYHVTVAYVNRYEETYEVSVCTHASDKIDDFTFKVEGIWNGRER